MDGNRQTEEYLCYQLSDCEWQTAEEQFDMITALLDGGVPHIALCILSYLDAKDLAMAEQVSTNWRDIIRYSYDWKQLVKSNVEKNPLWKTVFSRRGWYKYLSTSEHITREQYRQLHQCVSRDIHYLDMNWKNAKYTLTRINTRSAVACLRCDRDKIVSGHGGDDYAIKIWDRSTLELTKVLRGHKGTVNSLEYDDRVIVSSSDDTTVRVWDIKTGRMVNILRHHQKWVFALKFTNKTLVTGSGDKTVAVWNFESPTAITLKTVLVGHENGVYSVDLNETIIVSGAGDSTIKVWDSYTGRLIHTLHGHNKTVRCLLLRGSHIISGSYDRTIRMWCVDTGKCLQVFSGHQKWIMSIAYDGKRILSGSRDETIKVWNTLGGHSENHSQCLATLKEHTGWVRALHLDDFQLN